MQPKKAVDPYLENTIDGRIPKYSKVFESRNLPGEQDWVDNFNVKSSKNNEHLHTTQREFFDRPVEYPFLNRKHPYIQPLSPEPRRHRPLDSSLTSSYDRQIDLMLNKSMDVNSMIPMLRSSENSSPVERRKEKKWNKRIGIPIAEINEKLHWNSRKHFGEL